MNKIILDNKIFYYQVFFKNNKNMYLRVSENVITITAPKKYSKANFESFIIKHQRFILKTRVIPENSLYNQDKMLIWGREYNVIKFDGKELKIEDNTVYIPERFDEKNIEDFYRKQTIKLAISMIDEELVYSIKDIDLSNLIVKAQLMKSRLGSCHSTKRIIKLNSILARFDEKYLRAVLVHEIVHLRVGNHQTKFYQLLEKYIPDYRILSKQLNNLVKQYKI
ncbi:MAG: DUF45 domain-containing protein [Candidatus Izemoplasmatales bacterium]|nr:DUF45 domain-containing protein [Candidatus Izemoplasmatales bacterium]